MYQDELRHEAKLIVQGQQEFLREAGAIWASFLKVFGFKAG